MAITLKKKPEIDLYGTRWLHLKLDEQGHLSPCDVEAEADLSLLVGSTGDPLFQSHHAMINRHMQAIDAQAGVGTSQFQPPDSGRCAVRQYRRPADWPGGQAHHQGLEGGAGRGGTRSARRLTPGAARRSCASTPMHTGWR
ncbi:hypothetical protein ACPA9J_27660 [Pseudomonas aeruginosa]